MTNLKHVAIFSDLHLGIHQNSLFWHNIALKWADWFASELEKRDIKDIIFMGDFFDHRDEVAVNTLHVGYQILEKLRFFNIIMIPGNHDSFYRDHSAVNSLNIVKGWSNIRLLNETSQLMLGSKLASFIPWGGDIDKIKNKSSDYIFGHLEINSFKLVGSKICNKGINVDDILGLAPFVYSGHFHIRQKRDYGSRYINYVGNPFEMNFGDTNDVKGFYIINVQDNTEEFVENKISPKHLKIFVSDALNNDLTKYNIKHNIVKLVVDCKTTTDVIDKIQKNIILLKPATCTVEFLLDINSVDILKEINADMSGINIENSITEFINNLDITNKPELIKECLSYLEDTK